MESLSLDQLRVFAVVADAGSFSAAARRLARAQSAVSYAVQRLEAQIGADLFDRSAYRPTLTEAGRALLVRARRIVAEADDFAALARGIGGGLEAELALVIDSMFPMTPITSVLAEFQKRFPSVHLRIRVETLGAAAQILVDGVADIGLITAFAASTSPLESAPVGEIELAPVAAPGHPLAQSAGEATPDMLRDHVQLVLTDRSDLTAGKDHGVMAVRTWRIADLGAKHAMLLAGLGWGSMPLHMVQDDIAAGRLTRLRPSSWDGAPQMPRLSVVVARRRDRALGPGGRWLVQALRPAAA